MSKLAPGPTELVIFDCDGVLVDSEPITLRVIVACCADLGLSMDVETAGKLFLGGRWAIVMDEVQQRLGKPLPDDFTETFRARLGQALDKEVEAVEGIHDVLDALPYATCVASNGPQAKMRVTLGRTGLLSFFGDRIFSAYDIDAFKPAPGLFLHAAATMNVDPARCVVIEDSPNGWNAAHAAGMRCYAYIPDTHGIAVDTRGAHLLRSMRDLPGLIAAM